MLDLIDITGATITIDSIGVQEKIVNKIVVNKGHYVLKVKENQKQLLKDIKNYFINKQYNLYGNKNIKYYKTIEKDHGRSKIGEYFLSYDVSL